MDNHTLNNLRFAAFDVLWIMFTFGLADRCRNVRFGSDPIAISLLQVLFVLVLFVLFLMLNPRLEEK